jgi:hypothetical protein
MGRQSGSLPRRPAARPVFRPEQISRSRAAVIRGLPLRPLPSSHARRRARSAGGDGAGTSGPPTWTQAAESVTVHRPPGRDGCATRTAPFPYPPREAFLNQSAGPAPPATPRPSRVRRRAGPAPAAALSQRHHRRHHVRPTPARPRAGPAAAARPSQPAGLGPADFVLPRPSAGPAPGREQCEKSSRWFLHWICWNIERKQNVRGRSWPSVRLPSKTSEAWEITGCLLSDYANHFPQ